MQAVAVAQETIPSVESFAFEERPSGDFIDGFLAAFATANAALSGGEGASFYYSFDWIGDGEEERAHALHAAFESDEENMSFDIEELAEWRRDAQALSQKWLGRHLPPNTAPGVVEEFMEVLDAFLGDDPIDVFRVSPRPPANGGEMRPTIGSAYDHLLFETPDGRILLEFSVEG